MFDPSQLAALTAILRNGSFERAALALGVTQSAISQRMRALEEQVGTPLIIRAQPCAATEAGRRLFQHAEELQLLEQDVRRDLGLLGAMAPRAVGWPTLRLAVNADSLATWFVPAMASMDQILFDLVIDDQDHSADWLRRGEVRAAISSMSEPVRGCDCVALGRLRYLATASPGFKRRWFADGVVSVETLSAAPALTFNAKDDLQRRWADMAVGHGVTLRSHWLASSTAFVEAALCGMGWAMNPVLLVADALAEGRLEELVPDLPLDVPLYWHVSRSVKRQLAPVTDLVLTHAGKVLLPL